MPSSGTETVALQGGLPVSTLEPFARRTPACCPPDAPVRSAIETMRRLLIGSVIVVDAERAPLGILTLRDVVDRIALEPRALDAPIERYMSAPAVTLDRTRSAYDAALVMVRHGVRHVILLEDKRVTGIVSERDLFGLQSTGVRHLSIAIRSAALPHVTAYWLMSPLIAAHAASFIGSGIGKSGNPCARLIASC